MLGVLEKTQICNIIQIINTITHSTCGIIFPENATLNETAFKVNKFQKEISNIICTIMQSI
jgi:hypothetical protein